MSDKQFLINEIFTRLKPDIPATLVDAEGDKEIAFEVLMDRVARAWDDHPGVPEDVWDDISTALYGLLRAEVDKA